MLKKAITFVVSIVLYSINFLIFPSSNDLYQLTLNGQYLNGDKGQSAGFGDIMLPVFQKENQFFFIDASYMQGKEKKQTPSLGLGFRKINSNLQDESILGGYIFTDSYRTSLKNKFYQLNPGLEILKESSELRIQGYIPLSSRNQKYKYTNASELLSNDNDDLERSLKKFNFASGHKIYDTPIVLSEKFGRGLEIEAGKYFSFGNGFWLRAGAYHFNFQNLKNINGIEANIELPLWSNLSLLVQDNYDNLNHSRIALGFRFNLNDPFKLNKKDNKSQIQKRMTAPIIRHIARQSYGEAVPTKKDISATGSSFVTADNVWFFTQNGAYPLGLLTSLLNCTAENPCSVIDSATALRISEIAPNANLFFETGNYFIPQESNGYSWVNLQNNQSVFGRTNGWLQSAGLNTRPLINGGLVWGESSVNIADGYVANVNISNNNQYTPSSYLRYSSESRNVLGAAASGNLVIENSGINSFGQNAPTLAIASNMNLIVNSSTVSSLVTGSVNDGFATDVVGAYALNNININDSVINSQSDFSSSNHGYSTRGVYSSSGDAVINDSIITSLRTSDIQGSGIGQVSGVEANTVDVNNSIINSLSQGDSLGTSSFSGSTWGAYANDFLKINNSIIVSETQGMVAPISTLSAGAAASFGDVSINNTTLISRTLGNTKTDTSSGTSSSANSRALYVEGRGSNNPKINVSNSNLISSTSGNASGSNSSNNSYGILIVENGDISLSNTNILSTTNGTAESGGEVNAFGISFSDSSAKTLSFIGDKASIITSISNNGSSKSIDGTNVSVSNNSIPKSICSENGVNYADCQ